ncbi:MAG: Rpn family recombination-promoting nuclease/putative transposase [Clostridia bacterium]|nr:Rpn family recombination-promoting nuclease/putative transposase [Clostridia bacterium]
MITKTLVMKDDIMFKAFFSKTGNEKFLKDFLNAILGKEIKIQKVIHDARLEQLAREQKYGVLDLDVELESGEIINIEMQMNNHNNMEKRTTFYAGKKISEQLGPKAKYSDLKKIIVISILNYSFINLPEYVTKTVRVADKHRKYEINNDVTYYYIELEKFRNQNPDMTQPINQWLAFIDMERGDLLEMAEKENKLIKEAKENYNVLTGDAEVKRLAEVRLMSHLEEQAALETARDRGMEQGLEEGKKQGLEQGKKQGLEQGKKEGLEQGKKEGLEQGKKEITLKIAKKMKEQKIDLETISKTTGLTVKEIEAL